MNNIVYAKRLIFFWEFGIVAQARQSMLCDQTPIKILGAKFLLSFPGRLWKCHNSFLEKFNVSCESRLGSLCLVSSRLLPGTFSLFWFCFVYSDIINQSHKYDYMVSSVVLLTNHQIWGKPWGSPTHYPLLHVRTLIDAGQSAYPQSLATVMSSGIGL